MKPMPLGLIGGIGLSEVNVYSQRAAPDGTFSGCPHVHAITDEAYYVLGGTGKVEFHDLDRGYQSVKLQMGNYLHFPPLVLHRLISDGDLVILGMMGNVGLAERGEARIYFGEEVDADAAKFAELMGLPQKLGLEGALQRRDISVGAYQKLMRLWNDEREAYFSELRRFFDKHVEAVASKKKEFLEQVKEGPVAWAGETERRITALPKSSENNHGIYRSPKPSQAWGMCGVLRPILSLEKL
jgi:mannose-6-phosphate isomerase-like protein (cupin superfamily)